jgi:hypothetical protein
MYVGISLASAAFVGARENTKIFAALSYLFAGSLSAYFSVIETNLSSVEEFSMFTLYSYVAMTVGPSTLAQAVKLLTLFEKYPFRISEGH